MYLQSNDKRTISFSFKQPIVRMLLQKPRTSWIDVSQTVKIICSNATNRASKVSADPNAHIQTLYVCVVFAFLD